MATTVKPIGHEDRLTLVEHLDELRSRLIWSAVALVVIFAVCFWQNNQLLKIVNHPLAKSTLARTKAGKGLEGQIYKGQVGVQQVGHTLVRTLRQLSGPAAGAPKATRALLAAEARALRVQLAKLPHGPPDTQPVTLGPGEPFSATLTVALYFTLLIGLPLILYQLYAFVLPAFKPSERGIIVPLMAMVPVLFYTGVAFGYFLVLPAAVHFLQNFNSNQFNVLIQAKDYYKFSALTLIAMGVVFQLPVAVLAAVRVGIVTPKQLSHYRRYAIVVNTIIAAALPGTDPVSMLVELVPLLLLYEFSVGLARLFGRGREPEADEGEPAVDEDEPTVLD
jgi:sec-independent protein translocase protein TatC